jgi:hypothetical protein
VPTLYVIAKQNQQLVSTHKIFCLARRNGPRWTTLDGATKFNTTDSAESWLRRHRLGGTRIIVAGQVS